MSDLDDKLREILAEHAEDAAKHEECRKRLVIHYPALPTSAAIAQIKQLFKEYGWEEKDG